MEYILGGLVGMLGGFCTGYCLGISGKHAIVGVVPASGGPIMRAMPAYRPKTLYGPPPSVGVVNMGFPPEGDRYYCVRLHESCTWETVTHAVELADGSLRATKVYVRGHWEMTVVAEPGQWCRVPSWEWGQ